MNKLEKLERKLERCLSSGVGRIRHIYLFKTDNNMYKIGVAQNPNKRLKGVQTGCPTKVEFVFSTHTYRALNVEALLHEIFRENRVIGEWFNFNDDKLKFVISEIKKRVVQR
jgi:hypothetical protein